MLANKTLALLAMMLVCVFGCFFEALAEANASCNEGESGLDFGTWQAPHVLLSPSQLEVPWTPTLATGQVTESVRIFVSASIIGNAWTLYIYDELLRRILTITSKDIETFGSVNRNGIWTSRLKAQQLYFQLSIEGSPPKSEPIIRIDSAIAYPKAANDIHLYSTKAPTPDWQDLYSGSNMLERRAGDVVGMMTSAYIDPLTDKKSSWSCSGFLLTENLFVTNWHCGGIPNASLYWNKDVLNNMIVDFSRNGGQAHSEFSAGALIAHDIDLDFAVVSLGPIIGGGSSSGLPRPPTISIEKATKIGKVAKDIFLVHHPLGDEKKVSDNCRIVGNVVVNSITNFAHNCDTDPGSSGAPVFDLTSGDIIGLHHFGFNRDQDCTPKDAESKAVWMADILAKLCPSAPLFAPSYCKDISIK